MSQFGDAEAIEIDDTYFIKYVNKSYILCDGIDESSAIFSFRKSEMSTKKLRTKLKELTGINDSEVERILALCAVAETTKATEKPSIFYRPCFVIEDKIYEECAAHNVATGEHAAGFAVYDKESGSVEFVKEYVGQGGWTIKPILNDFVKKHLVLLPSCAEEYDDQATLLKDIEDFLNYWHEPVNYEERLIDKFYVLLSWIQDLVPQVPYRRILAPFGKGKSVFLDTLGSVCYRPLITGGASTSVSLIRMMNAWRGTAIIDEGDFAESDMHSFIIKILNLGYDHRTGYYSRASVTEITGGLSNTILSYFPSTVLRKAFIF